MKTSYDEEISPNLAYEILGYTPEEKWEHWKLMIGEYEITVLGYTGDRSKAYEVPERNVEDAMPEYSDYDVYMEAGGTSKEYKSLKRSGNLLALLPVILLAVSIVMCVFLVR